MAALFPCTGPSVFQCGKGSSGHCLLVLVTWSPSGLICVWILCYWLATNTLMVGPECLILFSDLWGSLSLNYLTKLNKKAQKLNKMLICFKWLQVQALESRGPWLSPGSASACDPRWANAAGLRRAVRGRPEWSCCSLMTVIIVRTRQWALSLPCLTSAAQASAFLKSVPVNKPWWVFSCSQNWTRAERAAEMDEKQDSPGLCSYAGLAT